MDDVEYPFEASELLRRARSHTSSMRVPIPLSKYWMALKEAAEEAGERTDKQELVLAILATTPIDGVALAERLRRYRLLRNGDLPGLFATDENVIRLPGPTLGRKGAGSAY